MSKVTLRQVLVTSTVGCGSCAQHRGIQGHSPLPRCLARSVEIWGDLDVSMSLVRDNNLGHGVAESAPSRADLGLALTFYLPVQAVQTAARWGATGSCHTSLRSCLRLRLAAKPLLLPASRPELPQRAHSRCCAQPAVVPTTHRVSLIQLPACTKQHPVHKVAAKGALLPA